MKWYKLERKHVGDRRKIFLLENHMAIYLENTNEQNSIII